MSTPGRGPAGSTGIRLHAPAPGWSLDADVVVVGSGVAGLTAALRCAAAGRRTVVVTKARLDDGSTRWAQGGIAAALGEGDSPEQHLDDTLVAGAGLCDEEAVRLLVTEGPDAVRRLIDTGAVFDTSTETGEIELTREGATTAGGSRTRAATPPAPRSRGHWSRPCTPRASRPWRTRSSSTSCRTRRAVRPVSPCTSWARASTTASAPSTPRP